MWTEQKSFAKWVLEVKGGTVKFILQGKVREHSLSSVHCCWNLVSHRIFGTVSEYFESAGEEQDD